MAEKETYYVQCAVCGEIKEVDDIDQLPEGWVINEDDYTFRCDKWECQDIEIIDDILDFYDYEKEEDDYF